MTRVGIVVAALFVLGLAISGKAADLASWAVGLVTQQAATTAGWPRRRPFKVTSCG
jgi:hypothetical protein